jgi:SnoaL-like domain
MATREELVAVAHAHAQAEAEGDMATTMATLEDDCVYEFQPSRRVFRGKEMAERYYEYFFNNTNMTIESYDMLNEWVTDDGVGQEYVIQAKLADGTPRVFNIVGILTFGKEKLSGERLYASDEFLDLLVGPIYAETVPLDA